MHCIPMSTNDASIQRPCYLVFYYVIIMDCDEELILQSQFVSRWHQHLSSHSNMEFLQ